MTKKFRLIALLILFSSAAVFAKDPIFTSTKSDKSSQNQDAQFLAVEASDLLVSDRNLWNGYALNLFASAAKQTRVAKGEFETTEDSTNRQSRAAVASVYGVISLKSRIALIVPNIEKTLGLNTRGGAPFGYVYDADAKELSICLSGETFTSGQLGNVCISQPREVLKR